MSRNRFVQIERTEIVESANYKKQRNIKSKLTRDNKALDAAFREARKAWVFVPPSNIVVSLYEDRGSIPAGLILSVPQPVGALVLCHRWGRIIESDDVDIDAFLDGSYEDAVAAFGLGLDDA